LQFLQLFFLLITLQLLLKLNSFLLKLLK
jgi:hypothetical protein